MYVAQMIEPSCFHNMRSSMKICVHKFSFPHALPLILPPTYTGQGAEVAGDEEDDEQHESAAPERVDL